MKYNTTLKGTFIPADTVTAAAAALFLLPIMFRIHFAGIAMGIIQSETRRQDRWFYPEHERKRGL